MNLDDLDRRLIAVLRTDARTPVADLARRLSVARATVQNRINRLERDGVIRGYTILVASDADLEGVRAHMNLAVESRMEPAVLEALRGRPEVRAVHHTTGQWDLILELKCETLADFNTAVGEIRLLDGVRTTESNILLASHH